MTDWTFVRASTKLAVFTRWPYKSGGGGGGVMGAVRRGSNVFLVKDFQNVFCLLRVDKIRHRVGQQLTLGISCLGRLLAFASTRERTHGCKVVRLCHLLVLLAQQQQ